MNDKRKKIETLINDTLMALDPSGDNSQKYRNMFQRMNDKEFDVWCKNFLDDELSNIRIDISEFDQSHTLKWKNVTNCAKNVLHINLFEYVYMPWLSSDPNRPVRSRYPMLTGYLNIKRPQQLVTKKTGLSTNDNERDEMTNAVKGDAKNGTMSGIENQLLAGIGANVVISELLGARGDNETEYDNMLNSIAETGSVKLADIKTNSYDKPTLLKTDILLMAMGVKTDIVSESYYSVDKIRAAMHNL